MSTLQIILWVLAGLCLLAEAFSFSIGKARIGWLGLALIVVAVLI